MIRRNQIFSSYCFNYSIYSIILYDSSDIELMNDTLSNLVLFSRIYS